MMTPQWTYTAAHKNGDTYNGSIEGYGLACTPSKGRAQAVLSRTMSLTYGAIREKPMAF